jgi:hypothetical protein
MRNSRWTPSIVPNGNNQTVYLVQDDLGRRTPKQPTSNRHYLLTGQYHNPVRVIAFNPSNDGPQDD